MKEVTQEQVQKITDRLDLLERKDLDMKGRRVINAGRALSASDLVTLGQVRDLIALLEDDGS